MATTKISGSRVQELLDMANEVEGALRDYHDKECCSKHNRCSTGQRLEELSRQYRQGAQAAGFAPVVEDIVADDGTRRPAAGSRGANQFGEYQVHRTSDKQLGFIRKLIGSRLVPSEGGFQQALKAFQDGTLNKRQATDLIDWLLTLPEVASAQGDLNVEPQLTKVEVLALHEAYNRTGVEFLSSLINQIDRKRPLSAKQLAAARKWIRP